MKSNACCLAAAAVGLLASVSTASAAFVNLFWDAIGSGPITDPAIGPSPHVYWRLRAWARFNTTSDRLLGIQNASISIDGNPLFQHPLGDTTAPSGGLMSLAPALAWDSFVTIGQSVDHAGLPDDTVLESGSMFTGPGGSTGFTGGWYNGNPADDQGAPGAHGTPISPPPMSGFYVLIAQFSFQDPIALIKWAGSMDVVWQNQAGAITTSPYSFNIPAPGCLALLAVAGLSRRRRHSG